MASWIRSLALAVVATLAFTTIGCYSLKPPPPMRTPVESYRVGPPDTLGINILPDPQINRSVTIRPDGMISIDLIGDVPASGRTVSEIAEDIQTRVRRYKRDATVSVNLTAARSPTVTVLGRGGNPKTFALAKETRIAEAMANIGGGNEQAANSRIRVVRVVDGEVTVHKVNLDAIEDGDLSSNIFLAPGDLIVVPVTYWSEVGFVARALFWPLQQVLGFGTRIATTVVTGGI